VKDAKGVKITLKREEDTAFVAINDEDAFVTKKDTALLKIESEGEAIITKANIAGNDSNIENAGKKVETEVRASSEKITIALQFENYKPMSLSFTLTKETVMATIACTVANIEDVFGNSLKTVTFDSNNSATIELTNIKYSSITLNMTMDSSIKTAKIESCKDERSATYSTAPTEKDLKGIFCGHVIREETYDGQKKE